MRIIYNRFIPFGPYHGLNLFGTIFVQRRWGKMYPYELNHEFIHTLQQWEMTYLGFYLWYVAEYMVRLVMYRFNTAQAYCNVSLEREAYLYERDPDYWRHRPPFAWTRLMRKKKNGQNTKKDA